MSNAEQTAYHVVVHGRVQGVGFRYTAQSKAVRLGLKGWIRNCPDGTVESHFEGSREQTGKFLLWLKHGPPGSRVLRIDKKSTNPQGCYKSFNISY